MRESPPKLVFSLDYSESGGHAVWLSTLRWSPFNSGMMLAYSPKYVTVISRDSQQLKPKQVRHIPFDSVAEAEFLPFAVACMPPFS